MYARPEDIANLCAIYQQLATEQIKYGRLERYLQQSMLIDSESPPAMVLRDAVENDLVKRTRDSYVITKRGRGLANRHREISTQISDPAKEYLLRKVYADRACRGRQCATFLSRFEVDTTLKTFVLQRTVQESPEIIWWLKTLERLGLIEVDARIARVHPAYLDLVNDLLRELREATCGDDEILDSDRTMVGEFAEERAMHYESVRLSRSGHKDLCPLIKRVSLVDRSAGFDILSFRGAGKKPEDTMYIEVKGTKKTQIDFIWSRNERGVASKKGRSYWLYIYTHVDLARGTCRGPVRIVNPSHALIAKGFVVEPLDVHVYERQ